MFSCAGDSSSTPTYGGGPNQVVMACTCLLSLELNSIVYFSWNLYLCVLAAAAAQTRSAVATTTGMTLLFTT